MLRRGKEHLMAATYTLKEVEISLRELVDRPASC